MRCEQKRIYFTERRALLMRLRFRQIFKKDQRQYNCDKCGFWHLTSRLYEFQDREARSMGLNGL